MVILESGVQKVKILFVEAHIYSIWVYCLGYKALKRNCIKTVIIHM